MTGKKFFFIVVVLVLGWFAGTRYFSYSTEKKKFSAFRTDFSQHSIDLKQIQAGGPGKDDIPSLTNPKFTSVKEAITKPTTEGVLVDISGKKRFYPFSILVWHEVVNDELNGVPYAVTYSPFCGSAVVFQRRVGENILTFRSTGLLFQNNLLFYDTQTESFWSQALNKAVAGSMNNQLLQLVPTTQILPFSEIQERHEDAEVLSTDTGWFKNYSFNPNSGYEEADTIPFPVFFENKRFSQKEMMFVIPFGEKSMAFPLSQIPEEEVRERTYEGTILRAGKAGKEVIVTQDGKRIAGYPQMWFCWYAQHPDNGIIWDMIPENPVKEEKK